MSTPFMAALTFLLRIEAGYNPRDPGGSMRGVLQGTYDRFREWRGQQRRDVRQITDEEVSTIYALWYWRDGQNDKLETVDRRVALVNFVTGVNIGIKNAAHILQRSAGVREDAVFGPVTLAAVRSADRMRLMVQYLKHLRTYYWRLAQTDPRHRESLHGWMARIESIRQHVGLPDLDGAWVGGPGSTPTPPPAAPESKPEPQKTVGDKIAEMLGLPKSGSDLVPELDTTTVALVAGGALLFFMLLLVVLLK